MIIRGITDIRSLPEQSLIPSRYIEGLEIVNDNNIIVAAGFIRLTSEVIVTINPETPRKERLDALEQLIGAGVYRSVRLGLTDMHAFLTGEHQKALSRLLKNKYGFTGHTGEVLVLNIGG